MAKDEALSELQNYSKELLNNYDTSRYLSDQDDTVYSMCYAIEKCLCHGLICVSSNGDTVNLWGLINWTNVHQQKEQQYWQQRLQINVEKTEAQSWYDDEFKEELNQIHLDIHPSRESSNFDIDKDSPATQGLNAAVIAAGKLSTVCTPNGKIRVWIRHCLNTHNLSNCCAAIINVSNTSLLKSYYQNNALLLDSTCREVFIDILLSLDRLTFGFVIGDPRLDKDPSTKPFQRKQHSLKASIPNDLEQDDDSPNKEVEEQQQQSSSSLINENNKAYYYKLEFTPSSVLSRFSGQHQMEQKKGKTLLSSTPLQVFKIKLADLIYQSKHCDLAKYDVTLGIPNIVEGCCRLIDAAVDTFGLFKVNVESRVCQQRLQLIRITGTVNILWHVHEAIFVLVKFLMELPEPLLPFDLHGALITANDIENEADRLRNLQLLVSNLPWETKPTITRILATLRRALLPEHTKYNDLTTDILTRILGKAMMRQPNTSRYTQYLLEDRERVIKSFLSAKIDIFGKISEDLELRRENLARKIKYTNSIVSRFKTPISETNEQHIKALKILHSNLSLILSIQEEQNIPLMTSKVWQESGFRENFPLNDLKGGGILVIDCLISFFIEHAEIAGQLISQRSKRTKNNYPLPSTSTYLVRMLFSMFQLNEKTKDGFNEEVVLFPYKWLSSCDIAQEEYSSKDPSILKIGEASIVCETPLWRLLNDNKPFERLFSMSLLLFDRNWSRSGANCMDFNTILTETKCQLSSLLAKSPTSIDTLWQIWIGNQEKQRIAEVKGVITPVVTHMRRYKISWPGGVNVRSNPAIDGQKIGTRQLGDIVDTVVKVGQWVKIREIPGVSDNGWIAICSDSGPLLEEIET